MFASRLGAGDSGDADGTANDGDGDDAEVEALAATVDGLGGAAGTGNGRQKREWRRGRWGRRREGVRRAGPTAEVRKARRSGANMVENAERSGRLGAGGVWSA